MALPNTEDTIVAIATPPGSGAIGVIRLSGPKSLRVADAIFQPTAGGLPSRLKANRVTYGRIVRDGETYDQALLLTFHHPKSYTGQDVVELHTHGGPAVLKGVLGLCFKQGARPAGPGEFTLRAFLSGKIDLIQAESVLGLVHAQTDQARRQASLGLSRILSGRIDEIQTRLTQVYGNIQASLDYPEEGVPPAIRDRPLSEISATLKELLATAKAGDLTRRGARLALVGKPNAGKSSLLNALLGFDRSIVSEQPGTTRDYLEAPLDFDGLPVTAIDTAGIRSAGDEVEAVGVAASRKVAAAADLTLLVLDRSVPVEAGDELLFEGLLGPATLIVANKGDLPAAWTALPWTRTQLTVSARTGMGLEGLRQAVREVLLGGVSNTELWITVERHRALLEDVLELIHRAREVPDDLAALDLELAIQKLGEMTGRSEVAEETLEYIFSQFCVGK